MKTEKLNSILKNIKKDQVYKEYKDVPKNAQERKDKINWPLKKEWLPTNPEVLERIKSQLLDARNQVRYFNTKIRVRRHPEKLSNAKSDVDAYTKILRKLMGPKAFNKYLGVKA